MLRKKLVTPPEAAKAFVRDMRAFFKAKSQLMGRYRRETGLAAETAFAVLDNSSDLGCERAVPAAEGL